MSCVEVGVTLEVVDIDANYFSMNHIIIPLVRPSYLKSINKTPSTANRGGLGIMQPSILQLQTNGTNSIQ